MCNNILQYGHFYAWGREHGRETVSMRFAYKFQYFHICNTPHHNFLTYTLAKYAAKWGFMPTLTFHVEGADTKAQEQEMLKRRHIAVVGWEARWYDLFLKYKQEIIDLFAFKQSVTKACEPLMVAAGKSACRLGVHIRRGDYAQWRDGQYYFDDAVYAVGAGVLAILAVNGATHQRLNRLDVDAAAVIAVTNPPWLSPQRNRFSMSQNVWPLINVITSFSCSRSEKTLISRVSPPLLPWALPA